MSKILLVLLGGNFLAQAINAIFLPISTRYYSPEIFNDLAIFIAVLLIVSTIAGLRFDVAILKAKDNLQAMAFFYLSVFFSILIAIVLLLSFLIVEFLGFNIPIKYPFLLSISIVAVVIYNSSLNLANIQKKFGSMTRSRISQALSSNIVLVSWGMLITTPFGLFLGYCMMYSVGILNLFPKLEPMSVITLVREFRNNLEYPKYSVLESLSDVGGYQLPIAMIGLTQTALGGLLFMAIKIANIPIAIVARVLSNFYVVKLRDNSTSFLFKKALLQVSIVGVVLLLLLTFTFIKYESLILGDSWVGISSILIIILPWMIVQFITTVFNPIFYIFSLEKVISYIQILCGILRVLVVAITLYLEPSWVLYVFSISNLIFYLIWLGAIFWGFYKVKGEKKCLV